MAGPRGGRRRLVIATALYLLFGVALIAGSTPRRVGDAAEYVAMTDQLSRFHPPALSEAEIDRLEDWFGSLGSVYKTSQLRFPDLRAGGRQDLPHFWFYSALTVPAYWVVRAVDVHPNFAFALVNLALLAGGLAVVHWRVGLWPALLIFAGPIIWWIDKPHTEVFTLSLLAVALALLDRWPGWSFVLVGVTATQNPPIALALPVLAMAVFVTESSRLRSGRTWAGLLAGAAVAAIHPVYYLVRLEVLTPTVATGHTEFHVPSRPELGAFIWDPNIGLVWGYPLLVPLSLLALALAVVRLRHHALSAGVIAAVPIALIFVATFAQSKNFNHGGTFGICRWALWLVPLAIPLFDRWVRAGRPWAPFMAVAVAVSVVVSVAVAHPRYADHHDGGPSYAARFLWQRYPSLDNPVVEVFTERLAGPEAGIIPVAASGCTKLLLVGGVGPSGCPVGSIPQWCRPSGALCYANRSGDSYRFASTPIPFDWADQTSSP